MRRGQFMEAMCFYSNVVKAEHRISGVQWVYNGEATLVDVKSI